MPPSTVFSYWRRDHRRSSASPVSSSARVNGASNVPQLPFIPNSTALPTTFSSEGPGTQVSSDYQAEVDLSKDNIAVSTAAINAPSSSSATLAVPSASSDKDVRPHSSPEEREIDLSLTPQSNYSQPSGSRPDHVESDSSKPNSPFRLSFGKGRLNSHSQSSDSHLKRSSTPDMAQLGHSRFKAPPDESATERTIASRRDHRYESTISRRQGDRDVSAEPVHHKSGKAMLHLLNPMSLLARRRSSQVAGRAEDANIRARNVIPAIPDDYDPRIRGNIVHDFSAPRPRRNLSAAPVLLHGVTNRHSSHEPSQTANGTQSCSNDLTVPVNDQRKRHSEYSPVFREHFEEDQKALQVENKAYLQSSLLTNPSHHESDAKSVPVFARNLPSSLPDPDREPHVTDNNASTKGQEIEPADDGAPLDADTVEVVPHQPLGLPKHLKSNASRFSFDMNGVESSTQEKLLEEKHKEKEAARRAKARLEGEFSDADDDFDNDLIDDMDDLEEKIPGVNVDADEEYDFKDFSGPGDILNNSWLAPGLSPVIASPSSPTGPSMAPFSNAQGDQTLAPETEISRSSSMYDPAAAHLSNETPSNNEVEAFPQPQTASSSMAPQMTANTYLNTSQPLVDEEDDDLYFDDGEFGDLTADIEGEKFDESIFDDETSHLYDRKPAAQRAASVRQEEPTPGIGDVLNEHDGLRGHDGGLKHVPSMASDYREVAPKRYGHEEEEMPDVGPAKSYGGVLSEHNLEALHNALAKAANDSATDDRFGRCISVSEQSLGHESVTQTVDSHSGLVSDDSRLSQLADVVGVESVFDDFDYDDNDAALYDDPIIAAANAEALENDDEGFYGQEFGFYAQAYGNCTSELTNGGYFGPRGIEGITRSFSSRGKFREPSLTPITERSEWSTRNSVISLAAHGAAHSNPLSSPGLAQLVDMGSIEDEMTLSALLRLRRGAWGGSNGSLRSSSGSPPPHPHPSSNRGSFTGLSDVSPTVYNAPPDAFGGTSATDSPIDRWGPPHNLSQQQNSIEGE
ncbi:hypothetical protein BDV36DRAFT_44748 [Aspergillus pseudocaelatus]|uniref:Uncharacterized protein n=1 Tax=Aspergillus pseudocaelatus TaxID=1825620 RepID=A0ABQ6W799_9EURO|nr:hypothetical protein BDV36DRAFT_44748 [Aspergillus pseudocaelatus]